MDLILCVYRKVSSGRSPNTLWILHHKSHREERPKYVGSMTEIFKPLELDSASVLLLSLLVCPFFHFVPLTQHHFWRGQSRSWITGSYVHILHVEHGLLNFFRNSSCHSTLPESSLTGGHISPQALLQTALFSPKRIKNLIAKCQLLNKGKILSHFWHTLPSKEGKNWWVFPLPCHPSEAIPSATGWGILTTPQTVGHTLLLILRAKAKPWTPLLSQPLWVPPQAFLSCWHLRFDTLGSVSDVSPKPRKQRTPAAGLGPQVTAVFTLLQQVASLW